MSRDKILTKLAMNVAPSVWPDGESHFFYEGEILGWNEYQLRRAELIKSPSWDDAPEWAQWLAQDASGQWMWYGDEPSPVYDAEEWQPESGKFFSPGIGTIPAGHDWRDTLEQRPQTKSDIKKCKHCDVTFQRPHVDGIPDDRCTRCDDEIKALWPEHKPAKTWWTSKTCTQCGHTTAAKVSDDKPVCPGCVAVGGVDYAEDSDAGSALSQVMEEQMRAAAEKWERGDMEARSKYHREVKPGVWIDVYDVLQAWGVSNPALQHLIKKALAPGQRGHKDLMTDMDDIVASAKRAKELES